MYCASDVDATPSVDPRRDEKSDEPRRDAKDDRRDERCEELVELRDMRSRMAPDHSWRCESTRRRAREWWCSWALGSIELHAAATDEKWGDTSCESSDAVDERGREETPSTLSVFRVSSCPENTPVC